MPKKACSSLLFFGTGISVSALNFYESGWMPSLDTTSPKNGIDVHLKWYLSLFNFKFTTWHCLSTLYTASSWSVLSLSYPITRMSTAIPNTFGISLNISSILHWNMSPTGNAPNGRCLYLYLPSHLFQGVWWCPFLAGAPAPPWMVFVVNMPCVLVLLGMACCQI